MSQLDDHVRRGYWLSSGRPDMSTKVSRAQCGLLFTAAPIRRYEEVMTESTFSWDWTSTRRRSRWPPVEGRASIHSQRAVCSVVLIALQRR